MVFEIDNPEYYKESPLLSFTTLPGVACGNITYTSSNKLISGKKRSCGCENPYAPKRRPKPEYEPFTDCKAYRPGYARGCTALVERLCETRGKCSFYKRKETNEL